MTLILTALLLTGRSVAFTSSRISRCTLDVFQTRAHTTQIYDVAVYKKTERDKTKCMTRIDFIRSAILVGSFPCFANAANLPQNNGADLSRTGSIETKPWNSGRIAVSVGVAAQAPSPSSPRRRTRLSHGMRISFHQNPR